jgi:hypothetical protein
MKTKRNNGIKAILKLALLTTFILSMVSCSKDSEADLTQENLTATNAKGGKQVTRPVSISVEALGNFNGMQADFTGKMTHAGKISGTSFYSSFVFTGPNTATYTSDVDIFYAANGDEIRSQSVFNYTFSFETEPISATYTGTTTFTGGTSRFAGATGSMEIEGTYIVTGEDTFGGWLGISKHTGHGTITY